MSSDEELSDLDEEQFNQLDKEVNREQVLIDEQVYKIKPHRRTPTAEDSSTDKAKDKSRDKGKDKTREKTRKDRARTPGKRPKKEDGEAEHESPDEAELDPETRKKRELERRMDAALKPTGAKRRKRVDEVDLEKMEDEAILRLRHDMQRAAQDDADCIRNGVPAINKLQMLPQVREIVQKHTLADSILDNNLLEAVRMWLEPLPDASLPAFEIQQELFAAIERLPIKTVHLRESGLGKVVVFYQKSKRPQLAIKRAADRLIGEWSRPIMGRSDNYRDRAVATRTYDPESRFTSVGSLAAGGSQDPSQLPAAEAAALRRNRAHIPTVNRNTYDVAPQSQVNAPNAAAKGEDQYKRLRMKMMGRKAASAKKATVSIEGKELRT